MVLEATEAEIEGVAVVAEELPPAGPLRQPLVAHDKVGGPVDAGTKAGAEGSELVVHTAQPPVLCTGFEGSVASAAREAGGHATSGIWQARSVDVA